MIGKRPKGFFDYEEAEQEQDPRFTALADKFLPPEQPENVERVKSLRASFKPPAVDPSGYTGEDEVREARGNDALANGLGRVSDALYAATTKRPVQFNDRKINTAKDVAADVLKDPAHNRNVIYRQYLKTTHPEIFDHYPPELFERITRDDEDAFDLPALKARLEKTDPLLEDKRKLIAAQTKKALRPPQEKSSPYIVVTGKGGEQYFANPRDPNQPVMPVKAPEGEQLVRPGNDPRELDAVGWTRRADAPVIKKEEAAAFRTAGETADLVGKNSAQMRGLIAQHGSELTGPVATTMASLATDMLLQVKTLAQLGVLSKSDEDLLNRLVPNPTGINGALTSTASLMAQLDQFDTMIRRKLEAKANALGYARAATAANGVDLGEDDEEGLTPEDRAFIQEYEAKNGSGR